MRYQMHRKGGPKIKQSTYLKGDLRKQVREEAKRLDRSMSWVIQQCVQLELANIQALESAPEEP